MKTIVISAFITLLLSISSADNKLTGRWETKPSVNGNVTGVVFKGDGSFEGYVNRKPFVSGNYTLEDDVFTFTDNGCEGKAGIYKLKYFSNSDSLRFEVISDSCTERMEGMLRLIMGRVK